MHFLKIEILFLYISTRKYENYENYENYGNYERSAIMILLTNIAKNYVL